MLYVVSTPIGNLQDITLRAIDVLFEADGIACESIESLNKLLMKVKEIKKSEYKKKKIFRVPAPLEEKMADEIAEFAREKNLCLVSDAGTPLISDPGGRILLKCYEKGVKVVPIPGPSAVSTILSVSPFDSSKFLFLGFIPKKKKKRFFQKIINGIGEMKINPTIVFFDSPKRIKDTINVLKDIIPEAKIVIGREMTKFFEEFLYSKISEIKEVKEKGEITVAIKLNNNKKLKKLK